MPASWSAAADLHFPGGGHQLTTETRGQTAVWTITPERPVWGSQRLVMRSSRPLPADREMPFPDISPLGRGAVDACLAVVNGDRRPATIENPVGLERDRLFLAISSQGVRRGERDSRWVRFGW